MKPLQKKNRAQLLCRVVVRLDARTVVPEHVRVNQQVADEVPFMPRLNITVTMTYHLFCIRLTRCRWECCRGEMCGLPMSVVLARLPVYLFLVLKRPPALLFEKAETPATEDKAADPN